MAQDKTFTLFWLTGQSELVKGKDIAQAMTLAGYSQGAVRALDFQGEGDLRDQYTWDETEHTWSNNKIKSMIIAKS